MRDRAEDDVDVGVAEDRSVGVQGCCKRLVVHLHHRGGTVNTSSHSLNDKLWINLEILMAINN